MTRLSPKQLADATGIPERTLRDAFAICANGKPWRGHHLPVVQMPGQRGGKGGVTWRLDLTQATPALLKDYPALIDHLDADPEAAQNTKPVRIEDYQFQVADERLAMIEPALDTKPRSRARGEALRQIAATAKPIWGTTKPPHHRTIAGWVTDYESGGYFALIPKDKGHRGKRRVAVTLRWDRDIDLCEDAKAQVVRDLDRHAQSLVSNDDVSGRELIRVCQHYLANLCYAAGSQIAANDMAQLCELNAKWSARFEEFRLVYKANKDHGALQDREIPRTRRALHEVPMGALGGDVHYCDIVVRDKGQPVRVRLIAWMDLSSLYLWVTVVILSKGKGITQEHVAQSLAQVTLCPWGGFAGEYHLDNGSEYDHLRGGVKRLSALAAQELSHVVKAKPYSPQSKGYIEGAFRNFQGLLKGLPGYIGGDRTDKKTQNKGQVVEPYQRGLDNLAADIDALVAIYNNRPQSGRLNGLSPLETLEKKIRDTGFVAKVPTEDAFDIIFSKPETRVVNKTEIRVGPHFYTGGALNTVPAGTTVNILIPMRNKRERIILDTGADQFWLTQKPVFDWGDTEGAKYQATLEAEKMKAIRQLGAGIDHTASVFEDQKGMVERIGPDVPAPETWATQPIYANQQIKTDAEREAEEDERRRADINEFLAMFRGAKGGEASDGHR